MSDANLDPHLREEDEHVAPALTTPQGTQANGVEHGHEGRDILFGPLVKWFIGLGLFLGLTVLLGTATFRLWGAEVAREDQLPSPLFAQQGAPPEPRILPNPIDSGLNPMEHVKEYPESLPQERLREAQAAEQIGVLDARTGLPILSDRVVSEVVSRYGTAGGAASATHNPVQDLMPSGSSGGTVTEDRLR
jgi:hypothetical protein